MDESLRAATTLDDGYATTLYVDPKSWLITHRRDVRTLHVDIDPTPTTIEQRMSDFRQVDGVWFPFAKTETDLRTGKVLETTTIRTITVNPKIDEAIFEKLCLASATRNIAAKHVTFQSKC